MAVHAREDGENSDTLVELKLVIPRELFIAYQRCTWIRVHETGQKPLDVMREVVQDFLVKHGC